MYKVIHIVTLDRRALEAIAMAIVMDARQYIVNIVKTGITHLKVVWDVDTIASVSEKSVNCGSVEVHIKVTHGHMSLQLDATMY
jgi:hypothetical protein